jgi:glycosyltransferase involved in cell wall biosynthesis
MVSIIMGVFNRPATIQRAVDSVLAQTHADWELIIVDDGSTGETLEVLAQLTDPRVRIVTHSENRGVCAARNTGLDQMRGEWFTILDSDDEMAPDALEVMLDCAKRTGATAITCNCLDHSTGQFSGSGGPIDDGWLTPTTTAKCRGEHWGLTSSSLLGDLRFDERVPSHEDIVWLQINRKAHRHYLHRALRIFHTEGDNRLTKAMGASSLRDKADVYAVLAENRPYLRELRRVSSRQYLRLLSRIWAARLLRPVLALTARMS